MMKKRAILLIPILFLCSCKTAEPQQTKIPQYNEVASTSYTTTDDSSIHTAENQIDSDDFSVPVIHLSQPTPDLGNSQQNLKSDYYCGLVCPDEDNKCTYITALGYDNLLYRKTKNTMELLLDKTAWALNLLDDKLYCIINSNSPVNSRREFGMDVGDIYCYDLATQNLTLVLKANAASMKVTNDYIYYIDRTDKDSVFKCKLDGTELCEVGSSELGLYGEYIIVDEENTSSANTMLNKNTDEKIKFSSADMLYSFSAQNDVLYYISGLGGKLMRYNSEIGEAINILPDDCQFIGSYTIIDDVIYTAFSFASYIINPNGEFISCNSPISPNTQYYYDEMFYDNETIYSVKCNENSHTYKLVQLEYDAENKVMTEKDIL